MSIFIGIMCIIAGLINVKFPGFVWFLSTGWQFSNAEPSDVALGINRVLGYFLLIVGACYILSYFVPAS